MLSFTDTERARDNYLNACKLFERHQFYKEMVEFGMKAYELDTTNEEALRYIENGYKGLGYGDE